MLSGGGEATDQRAAFDRFLTLANERGLMSGEERPARIAAVVAAVQPTWGLEAMHAALRHGSSCEVLDASARVAADGTGRVLEPLDAGLLLRADAVYVGDGDAAALIAALAPSLVDIRRRVAEGMPYFGVGAGAAIASELAHVGGFAIGGVPVAPGITTDNDLELRLEPGLGLIDLPLITSAAQLGRLGVAIGGCEAELFTEALALDELTTLCVADGALELLGAGSMWQVQARDDGSVSVTTTRAA